MDGGRLALQALLNCISAVRSPMFPPQSFPICGSCRVILYAHECCLGTPEEPHSVYQIPVPASTPKQKKSTGRAIQNGATIPSPFPSGVYNLEGVRYHRFSTLDATMLLGP